MSFIIGTIIGSMLAFVALALAKVSKDDKE